MSHKNRLSSVVYQIFRDGEVDVGAGIQERGQPLCVLHSDLDLERVYWVWRKHRLGLYDVTVPTLVGERGPQDVVGAGLALDAIWAREGGVSI